MKQIVAVFLAAVFPMWLLAADRQQDERTRSGLSAADFSACIDGVDNHLYVLSTEPGLHIYTANGLKGALTGKQGVAYPRRSAVCFESCHFQNSPNCPQFPSTVLRPGQVFRSRTVFRFSCPLSSEVGVPATE